jgi:peptide subunit release factor 1 (eRF1)
MFGRDDLQPLLKRTGKDSTPVLSLYLDVDLSRPANRNRGILVAARALLANLREEIDSHPVVAQLDQDAAHVEAFLEAYQPSGRSLVLFCDVSEGLLWQRTLPVALPPDARYRADPHVRPLIEMLDEQERYGVVLVDRRQASFFSVFLGEIEEHRESFAPLEVRATRTVGTDHLWSEKRFHRRADEHAHLHIKQVAGLLRDLQRETQFDRLVLCGPAEATAELQRLLPRALVDRVAATWKLPIETRETTLLAEVMRLQDEREEMHESGIVEELLSAAMEGHHAVVGLGPTLEAVRAGRVVHLIYVADEPMPGAICTSCKTLAQRSQGACGFCQATLAPVRDLLGRMARLVSESGGRLEHVRGSAVDWLRASGGIGGLLRF